MEPSPMDFVVCSSINSSDDQQQTLAGRPAGGAAQQQLQLNQLQQQQDNQQKVLAATPAISVARHQLQQQQKWGTQQKQQQFQPQHDNHEVEHVSKQQQQWGTQQQQFQSHHETNEDTVDSLRDKLAARKKDIVYKNNILKKLKKNLGKSELYNKEIKAELKFWKSQYFNSVS
ncbi:hypothetical protein TKK_0002945 [Trichogramma kaykai]